MVGHPGCDVGSGISKPLPQAFKALLADKEAQEAAKNQSVITSLLEYHGARLARKCCGTPPNDSSPAPSPQWCPTWCSCPPTCRTAWSCRPRWAPTCAGRGEAACPALPLSPSPLCPPPHCQVGPIYVLIPSKAPTNTAGPQPVDMQQERMPREREGRAQGSTNNNQQGQGQMNQQGKGQGQMMTVVIQARRRRGARARDEAHPPSCLSCRPLSPPLPRASAPVRAWSSRTSSSLTAWCTSYVRGVAGGPLPHVAPQKGGYIRLTRRCVGVKPADAPRPAPPPLYAQIDRVLLPVACYE